MGSVAFGLGQIGAGLEGAKELQRKEQLERVKSDLESRRVAAEEGQLGVSQKYAGLAEQRQGLEQKEFDERQRVAKLPKFIGFRTVGGKLYYGLQDASGKVTTQEVTGVDSAQDAQALEQSIQALPADAQPAARATIVPYLQAQDFPGARGALKPIIQKYAESQLPGQETVSSTTQNVTLDTPNGPQIVQIPKTTTTRKEPAGKGTSSVAPPKEPKIPQPRAVADVARDMGLPAGAHILGAKPPTRGEISKVIDPVGDADRRYKIMLDAAQHPNPQNDIALLFNHIGMTLSAQRGARITESEIRAAIAARSLPEDLQAQWEKVSTGQFLTPDQRKNMVELGQKNRELLWQQAWEKAKAEGLANKLPRTLSGLPPVGGIHYVGEDVNLAKGGAKARIVSIHPDGSYEVKTY